MQGQQHVVNSTFTLAAFATLDLLVAGSCLALHTWHLVAQVAVHLQQVAVGPGLACLPAGHALFTPIHGHLLTDTAHLQDNMCLIWGVKRQRQQCDWPAVTVTGCLHAQLCWLLAVLPRKVLRTATV